MSDTKHCFAIEDTTGKCYRDFSNALLSKGWRQVNYRKRSKLEKRRLPVKELPLVVCVLNEKDINYSDLNQDQICNHFEGITSLTTKRGLCDLLRSVHLTVPEDFNELAPRCYNLGDPMHRDEFIDDFRMVAAVNILKWYVLHSTRSSFTDLSQGSSRFILHDQQCKQFSDNRGVDINMLYCALTACLWFIRVKKYGEWPGVDISKYFKDKDVCLEESQWCCLLDYSYVIAEHQHSHNLSDIYECISLRENFIKYVDKSRIDKDVPFDPFLFKVKSIISCFARIHKQFSAVDGFRNIWVMKAPDSSCGIGIKLFSNLDEILQNERGMGGRTIQKYIEFPLLAPAKAMTSLWPPSLPQIAATSADSVQFMPNTKFDLRVWVLVTSFKPLTAYIYSTVYGRRCSSEYNAQLSSLSDSFIHLTNYSVQKKQKFYDKKGSSCHDSVVVVGVDDISANNSRLSSDKDDDDAADNDKDSVSTSNSARKLRHVCKSFRLKTATEAAVTVVAKTNKNSCGSSDKSSNSSKVVSVLSEVELLITHEEVINIVQQHYRIYQDIANNSFCCNNNSSSISASAVNRKIVAEDVLQRIGLNKTNVWLEYIWPSIKHKIQTILRATKSQVIARPRSFEFLGFDVILDELLYPWVLEVNMSPAMAHRTVQQSHIIRHMSEGIVELAIVPWTATNCSNSSSSAGDNSLTGQHCNNVISDKNSVIVGEQLMPTNLGSWEKLIIAGTNQNRKENLDSGSIIPEYSYDDDNDDDSTTVKIATTLATTEQPTGQSLVFPAPPAAGSVSTTSENDWEEEEVIKEEEERDYLVLKPRKHSILTNLASLPPSRSIATANQPKRRPISAGAYFKHKKYGTHIIDPTVVTDSSNVTTRTTSDAYKVLRSTSAVAANRKAVATAMNSRNMCCNTAKGNHNENSNKSSNDNCLFNLEPCFDNLAVFDDDGAGDGIIDTNIYSNTCNLKFANNASCNNSYLEPVNSNSSSNSNNSSQTTQSRRYSCNINNIVKEDISLLAVAGTGISVSVINRLDSYCVWLLRICLIQRWWRRYSDRLYLFQSNQRCAATIIQCIVRRWKAKQILFQKVRHRAAVILQSRARIFLSQKVLLQLYRIRSAIILQRVYRGYKGRKYFHFLCFTSASVQIQRWYRYHRSRILCKFATKIVLQAQKWLQYRRRCAYLVVHLIRLYYLRRLHRTTAIQRVVRHWLMRCKQKHALRKAILRQLSQNAADKALIRIHLREKAQELLKQLRENVSMSREDLNGYKLRSSFIVWDFIYRDVIVGTVLNDFWRKRLLILSSIESNSIDNVTLQQQSNNNDDDDAKPATSYNLRETTAVSSRSNSNINKQNFYNSSASQQLRSLTKCKQSSVFAGSGYNNMEATGFDNGAGDDGYDAIVSTMYSSLDSLLSQQFTPARQRSDNNYNNGYCNNIAIDKDSSTTDRRERRLMNQNPGNNTSNLVRYNDNDIANCRYTDIEMKRRRNQHRTAVQVSSSSSNYSVLDFIATHLDDNNYENEGNSDNIKKGNHLSNSGSSRCREYEIKKPETEISDYTGEASVIVVSDCYNNTTLFSSTPLNSINLTHTMKRQRNYNNDLLQDSSVAVDDVGNEASHRGVGNQRRRRSHRSCEKKINAANCSHSTHVNYETSKQSTCFNNNQILDSDKASLSMVGDSDKASLSMVGADFSYHPRPSNDCGNEWDVIADQKQQEYNNNNMILRTDRKDTGNNQVDAKETKLLRRKKKVPQQLYQDHIHLSEQKIVTTTAAVSITTTTAAEGEAAAIQQISIMNAQRIIDSRCDVGVNSSVATQMLQSQQQGLVMKRSASRLNALYNYIGTVQSDYFVGDSNTSSNYYSDKPYPGCADSIGISLSKCDYGSSNTDNFISSDDRNVQFQCSILANNSNNYRQSITSSLATAAIPSSGDIPNNELLPLPAMPLPRRFFDTSSSNSIYNNHSNSYHFPVAAAKATVSDDSSKNTSHKTKSSVSNKNTKAPSSTGKTVSSAGKNVNVKLRKNCQKAAFYSDNDVMFNNLF